MLIYCTQRLQKKTVIALLLPHKFMTYNQTAFMSTVLCHTMPTWFHTNVNTAVFLPLLLPWRCNNNPPCPLFPSLYLKYITARQNTGSRTSSTRCMNGGSVSIKNLNFEQRTMVFKCIASKWNTIWTKQSQIVCVVMDCLSYISVRSLEIDFGNRECRDISLSRWSSSNRWPETWMQTVSWSI